MHSLALLPDSASLERTQVNILVFGSNEQGFHGAGAAGLAMRGTPHNNWRTDPAFLAAMAAPPGHPDRIGERAVFGAARGLQQGRNGFSYAICTCTRPGARRSIPLTEIERQLRFLATFARAHPQHTFTILPIATGYAGYTPAEMKPIWDRVDLPSNCSHVSHLC